MAEDKLPALEEIRERADAASPGPWEADVEHGYDMDDEPFTFDVVTGPDGQMALETLADLRFAAHARTDVPRLLAVVDAVLKLHGSIPYYAGADGCDHPEPPEETDAWENWADGHPIGTGGDRICLTEHIFDFCPECTRVAYDDDEEPVNEDCVRAPCGTREAITRELAGREKGDG